MIFSRNLAIVPRSSSVGGTAVQRPMGGRDVGSIGADLPMPQAHPVGFHLGLKGKVTIWAIIAFVSAATVVIGGVCAWQAFNAELRLTDVQRLIAQEQSAWVGHQFQDMQQRYANLSQQYEQITSDRDNLLTQVQRIAQQHTQAEAERSLLEQLLQRTGQQRSELLYRLTPLKEQVTILQTAQTRLLQERETLEKQLQDVKQRSQEKALRLRLTQMAKKQTVLQRELRDAKRSLQTASQREATTAKDLTKFEQRLEDLQNQYTQQVSENASLRRQVNALPKEVGTIAKEHERLIRDLADTHYNMGVMFVKKKDYVRASKEFKKVIELRPDDSGAYYNLGIVYAEHLLDREKAIKYFQRYLAVSPKGEDVSWAKQYIATWRAWEGEERLE